jgi:hypothetical protein
MTLIPFAPFAPDIADYNGETSRVATNVIPQGDGWGPFKSSQVFTSALPAACRGYFHARRSDGSVAIFAGTSTKLYLLDNTDLSWDDVSLGGGSYTALTITTQWQFAQFGNLVIAVHPGVVPQVFNLGAPATFVNLGGSPPQASYISIVGRFVVLTGLLGNPFRIQWSGLGNATQWTPGTNSSDLQDLPDGGIVRGVAGGEYGIIFQDTIIRRMIYSPGSAVVFVIEKVTEDKGLVAPYSLIKAGDRIFFLAAQGFYGMAGTSQPTPIGKERVDRFFLRDNADLGSPQLLIGAPDPKETRVYWSYKTISAPPGLFDRILAYDYALDRWAGPLLVTGEYVASLAKPGLTLESLDAISASIDALTFSLDDVSTAALAQFSGFNSSHQLGLFAGDNLEALLDTAEAALDKMRRVRVRGLRPVTDAPTCFGAVSTRETLQTAAAYSTEQGINARGLCPANVSTRLARGHLRIPGAVQWTYAMGMEPDFVQQGKR